MNFYRNLIRPFLFNGPISDPEWLHDQAIGMVTYLEKHRQEKAVQLLSKNLQKSWQVKDPRLQQNYWQLDFPNPVGLAAGFDKNGVAPNTWPIFGFGFAEVGTVTYHAQPGNPQPRLFRLPLDQAILNRMGFNNQGAADLADRLQGRVNHGYPLGINLGKSKITALSEAAQDYLKSFQLLQNRGDYFVVNVSSPNTPGLRSLQDADQLAEILAVLQIANTQQKPILVKIAPDLTEEAIAAILQMIKKYQVSGIIATNTTISRDGLKTEMISKTGKLVTEEAGGISGQPVREKSLEIIKFIYRQTQGELPIIGVGGIFNTEDAWAKITAGASLIQIYTGLVYEGPAVVSNILKGLLIKLEEHDLKNIREAVGLFN
jgi:dihydroorotate dehydrogenase